MENSIDGNGYYADSSISVPSIAVDDYVAVVIDSYNSSARSLWQCAEYVWKLYDECGMYEQKFTETLIDVLHIQRDTLYHWRKAWDLKLGILEIEPGFNFDGLTITHFYHASDYVSEHGVDWVMNFLETARKDGWSSRTLSGEMRMATNDEGTLPWIISGINKVLHKLQEIYGSSEYAGLSETKREKLRTAVRILEELTK